jgi:threonyl-tRNA synthetase
VAAFAGELGEGEDRAEISEALVAFVAVESGDDVAVDVVVGRAAREIAGLAGKLGTRRIMLYPYAHLSSQLAKPRVATGALDRLGDALGSMGDFEIHRAPFGYYKAFDIRCKGHPLSELAMTISPSDGSPPAAPGTAPVSEALTKEKTLRSEWHIVTPDGRRTPPEAFDFSGLPDLEAFYRYDREGTREETEAPPHIRLMREQEIADYEPASDPGNFRWYPKGSLIKRLLEQHVSDMVIDYGAMQVETPIMYDYDHPQLSKYLNRFPARQYILKSDDKEYFLRFAACFGQYMIQRDMMTSYRDLPMRLYELTHYSFRREQSGELAGLRRLRGFTMPDMHTLVRDGAMARREFLAQVRLCLRWLQDVNLKCVPAIRFVRQYLDENPEFLQEIVAILDQPVLVEVWDQRFFYFVAKFEMNFVDAHRKAACLSTVQIDVENTERFNITYIEEDGSRRHPLLMHTSVSGSVDRVVYAILEDQAMRMARGEKAVLPTWLAPTQVRVLPVSEAYVGDAMALADRIPFRVDVDDRDLKVGKKIRETEREWIPYAIVVGEKERGGGTLVVRSRAGEQREMSLEAFVSALGQETAGKPQLKLNTPKRLSIRPIFVG